MNLRLESISKVDDNYISEKLASDGCLKVHLDPDKLKSACEMIRQKLPEKQYDVINSGYSQVLDNALNAEALRYFDEIARKLCSYSFVKRYLWFPQVAGMHILWSFHSPDVKAESLTHAHLWHRDLDDPMGPQLKVMIPLVDTSSENGRFSACSKAVCDLQEDLLDPRITVDHYGTSEYLWTDTVRVTDLTMRDSFGDKIVDFDTKLGDAVLVDANSCYHKGGLVLDPAADRILIQITLGSASHSWLTQTPFTRRFSKFRKKLASLGVRYRGTYDVTKRVKIRIGGES